MAGLSNGVNKGKIWKRSSCGNRKWRQYQEKYPPFGDFHCISPAEGVRVFQTTGTTGIPVRSLLSKKDWLEVYYNQFMYFMYGYGITKADTIFIPFNYVLYLAWWGINSSFEQGGEPVSPGERQRGR